MTTKQTSLFEEPKVLVTYPPSGEEGLGTMEHAAYIAALGGIKGEPAPSESDAVYALARRLKILVHGNPGRLGITAVGRGLVAATQYDMHELTAWLTARTTAATLAPEFESKEP